MRWRQAGALLVAGFTLVGACTTDPGDVFRWELTPARADALVGELVTFEVRVKTKSDINHDVELAPGDVPAGLYVQMPEKMTSTQETAKGTIYVSPEAEPGSYTVEIMAKEVGGEFEVKTILVVVGGGGGADFSVEVDPTSFTMNLEIGKTFTYYVRPLNDFAGTVGISLSPLPDDLTLGQPVTPSTLTFAPGGGGQGGTFVLRYTPTPPVASPVELVVTVSGNGITHTRTITLTLPN